MIEHSFERNSMAECPLSFASSSLEPITRLWARSVAICNTCRPDAGTAVITCSRIFWSMLWYINKKNTQKNSKHHDHCLTSCITQRIMTGLFFFFIISNVSQEGVVGQHALMSTPLLLLLKQWMPWLNQGADNWLGRLPGIQFQYLVRGWVTSTQFHLTKQLKAFVSALQVYHKSCRFSLVQFSSTAQREKPTISWRHSLSKRQEIIVILTHWTHFHPWQHASLKPKWQQLSHSHRRYPTLAKPSPQTTSG